jgi:hypothetical protein
MTVLGRERPIRRLRWTVLASSGLIAGGQPSFLAKPTRSLTWFSSRRAVGSSQAEPLSARDRNPHLGRASDLLNAVPALRAAATIVVERRRLKTPKVGSSASNGISCCNARGQEPMLCGRDTRQQELAGRYPFCSSNRSARWQRSNAAGPALDRPKACEWTSPPPIVTFHRA